MYQRLKHLNRKGSTAIQPRHRVIVSVREFRTLSAKYLAGFVDAEGSVRLAKVRPEGWNPQYGPRVSVCNTNRTVVEDIQRAFGGILTNQPARTLGWKDAYQLVWIGRRVEPLLLAIRPHLRIKRRQARILLQFIGHRRKTRQGRVGRSFARLPDGVMAYREAIFVRMRKLNARGPPLEGARH